MAHISQVQQNNKPIAYVGRTWEYFVSHPSLVYLWLVLWSSTILSKSSKRVPSKINNQQEEQKANEQIKWYQESKQILWRKLKRNSGMQNETEKVFWCLSILRKVGLWNGKLSSFNSFVLPE